MAPKDVAYYARRIKDDQSYFSNRDFEAAFGFTPFEGIGLTAFLREEMRILNLLSANQSHAKTVNALRSITDAATNDPRWAVKMQAVQAVNREFVYWSVRRMGQNAAVGHAKALKASKEKKPAVQSETSDLEYESDSEVPLAKLPRTPSKATKTASTGHYAPLPRDFIDEVIWVRRADGRLTIISVKLFLDSSAQALDRQSVRPAHADLKAFLRIVSQYRTFPYVKNIHQLECVIHNCSVRMDGSAVDFQSALTAMFNQRTEQEPMMEVNIIPAPGMSYSLHQYVSSMLTQPTDANNETVPSSVPTLASLQASSPGLFVFAEQEDIIDGSKKNTGDDDGTAH